MNNEFFITGGTLPPDAHSYLARLADTELLDSLLKGEFCYVLNTRQMGKSSLMSRAAHRLREQGIAVVVLDLTAIGQNLTVEQWYAGLLGRMVQQTGLRDDMLDFWRTHRELGPMQRFLEMLRSVLLTPSLEGGASDATPSVPDTAASLLKLSLPPTRKLVIFIDEIDVVRSLPFSADEFFAGIRECYNRRAHDPVFEHLTFCLLGVAAPSDLIQDTRISPFNIGRRIELDDFTPDEARSLAIGLLPSGTNSSLPSLRRLAQRLLQRVLYWTNGHPYMTQRLCREIALQQAQGAVKVGDVDRLCERLFFTKTAQASDDNLAFVRNRLLKSEADLSSLLDLYSQILAGKRVRDEDANPLCSLLRLSGAVAVERGLLKPRNRIYMRVFDREWVRTRMPDAELRRQHLAFRRGVLRTVTVGAGVIALLAVFAGVAINRAIVARYFTHKAQDQEKLANARLSRQYVAEGMRLMDRGDAMGALTPLAEAIDLDQGDPERLKLHRMRFAAALNVTPHLDRIWFSEKPVRWAGYSRDRSRIAAVGDDGRARVWEVRSGAELGLEMRHDGPIVYAAFSPDGTRLVTCGSDACARLWDLNARKLLCTLHHPKRDDKREEVFHASWSQDGRRIATSYWNLCVVWDVSELGMPHKHRQETVDVYADNGAQVVMPSVEDWENAGLTETAFFPDGRRLAVLAGNSLGGIMDITRNKWIASIRTNELGGCYEGRHVEFDRKGRLLISGCFTVSGAAGKNGASIFDVIADAGKPLRLRQLSPFLRHESMVNYARFSPDEQYIVTASNDHTARVWNATSGKPLTLPLQHDRQVTYAEFSADGKRVVTASMDGTARVWDVAAGRPVCSPLRHAGAVVAAQFGKDSNHLFTASEDGTVRLWTLPSTVSNSVSIAKKESCFTFLRNASLIAVDTGQIRVCNASTGRLLFPALAGGPTFSGVEQSDDGRRILLKNHKMSDPLKIAQVWDAETERPLSPPMAGLAALSHQGAFVQLLDWKDTKHSKASMLLVDAVTGVPRFPPVPCAVDSDWITCGSSPFTPDDRAVVICDEAHNICLLDVHTGKALTPPMKHDAQVSQWIFSPDGRYLFTWTAKGNTQAWNVATGAPASIPIARSKRFSEGADNRLKSIAFSPDGRYAITIGETGDWLWGLNGSAMLRPYHLNLFRTQSLAISPDSKTVAFRGEKSWLWKVGVSAPIPLCPGHRTRVNQAVFSPDGRRVLSLEVDGTAQIWDTLTAQPVSPPLVHASTIRSAIFSSDGLIVATGSEDGILRVWDALTGEALTAPMVMRGRLIQLAFMNEGRQLVASTDTEGRIWTIPITSASLVDIQAGAQLLSGQKIDKTLGTLPVDPHTLRKAWQQLLHHDQP